MINEKLILEIGSKYKMRMDKKLESKFVPERERLHIIALIDYSINLLIENSEVLRVYSGKFPWKNHSKYIFSGDEGKYTLALESILKDLNILKKINEGERFTKYPGTPTGGFLNYWLKFHPNVDCPEVTDFDGHRIIQEASLNGEGRKIISNLETYIRGRSI